MSETSVRPERKQPERILRTGLDKGGADLIADGRIKVKSGAQPARFTEDSVVFDDGTELPADVVIFA